MRLNTVKFHINFDQRMGAGRVKASCLRVPKALGEKAINLTRGLKLLNGKLKVQAIGDSLIKEVLPEFEISFYEFPEHEKSPRTLVEALEDKLPPYLLASLPRSMDFVGEIVILEIPPELENYKRLLGETILRMHRRVHTVLAKAGTVKGVYRLREFEVLAGEGKTETIYREHGCTYHLDLGKVYFSPRLSQEHLRVASQVKEGETVIDMFAGVGPFSILIAKKRTNVTVYAIDVNPDAVSYLKRNVYVNRVEGKVKPVLGDAREVIKKELGGTANRVIMNLPERAMEYVDAACMAVKPEGGILHYYEFTNASNPTEAAESRLLEAIKGTHRIVKGIPSARIVRETAPFTWQVAVDVEIH
ncbi:MAG: class I SAM-dependent methyltransferase family protein [Candidatus Bathyarchaeia archaeon]